MTGGWTNGRMAAAIFGGIGALIALGLLLAGAVVWWIDSSVRDREGFLATPTERFVTATPALTSQGFDLDPDSDWLFTGNWVGSVRVHARGAAGRDVFVGVGPTERVATYLSGVPHDELTEIHYGPFRVVTRAFPGSRAPAPPASQPFWVARATGPGDQTLRWEVESGDWTVVLMNADGTPGVSADLRAGVRAGALGWVAFGLLVAGALLAVLSILLIVIPIRRAGNPRPPAPPPVAPGTWAAGATADR
jgi:hypothetical protein